MAAGGTELTSELSGKWGPVRACVDKMDCSWKFPGELLLRFEFLQTEAGLDPHTAPANQTQEDL